MSEMRNSPLDDLIAEVAPEILAVLRHPTQLVKLGVKGPGLVAWAEQHEIELPVEIYDTLLVGQHGVLARVATGELILECAPDDALLTRFESALQTVDTGVYRIEQQSVTLVLAGDAALGVLAQTCGVDFVGELVDRMVYTRVAGVSCGVLPREEGGQRVYRLWVDYSLAPYLWETLAEITAGLTV
ncbi:MAG TPA: hypothetical protein EYG11_22760 [Candidatus Latescibacteria bacterium]|nr:hypothetical protein [Candidatus Handelsmanbacteria bacterium]HIL11520.1 hypothetical protein [Candidatus Latescibacterota bacterium]